MPKQTHDEPLWQIISVWTENKQYSMRICKLAKVRSRTSKSCFYLSDHNNTCCYVL